MRKSIIIRKKCAAEGKVTEHYFYPETDKCICASCTREYRLNRYHGDPKVKANDLKYNKKWKAKNPEKVSQYEFEKNLKKSKIRVNFENAKKDFIVMNLAKLQTLHNIYGLTMSAQSLMTYIGDINDTTVSKIMMNIVKMCRVKALKKNDKATVKGMDLLALKVL